MALIVPADALSLDQFKPVLLPAVLVYVVVIPAPGAHVGSVPAEMVIAVGVPTLGLMVTSLDVCVLAPLHPLPTAMIFTVPLKPVAQFIVPDELIEPLVFEVVPTLSIYHA